MLFAFGRELFPKELKSSFGRPFTLLEDQSLFWKTSHSFGKPVTLLENQSLFWKTSARLHRVGECDVGGGEYRKVHIPAAPISNWTIANTADCTANRNGLNHPAATVVLCQLALHLLYLLYLLLLAGVGGTKRWQGTQLGVHGTLTAMCNSCSCYSSVLSAADKQWLWACMAPPTLPFLV
jgi:hypothetical protein